MKYHVYFIYMKYHVYYMILYTVSYTHNVIYSGYTVYYFTPPNILYSKWNFAPNSPWYPDLIQYIILYMKLPLWFSIGQGILDTQQCSSDCDQISTGSKSCNEKYCAKGKREKENNWNQLIFYRDPLLLIEDDRICWLGDDFEDI